ncbi:MAG: Gfo/Idh/MocA family oxidoreductase [Fimbriimonadaceae bacterium]|jgi:predicted dehydrogenase|nr:Gfo/Idh/MocA family oxidoreductase [Fimbriimonadaceae bacterium]
MKPNPDFGVAVIGAGFMGGAHTEALRRLGMKVTGILDVKPELSLAAAAKFGLPHGYESFEAVLSDPSVNAVHITTPNKLHHAMTLAALEAGKHVLCEKPLAMNSAESGELVKRAAEKPHLHTGVNYNIRFYPLNIEARNKDLGKIHSIIGSYVQDWLLYDTDYNWRVLAEEGGALRAVADIGTHWLDLVTSISCLTVESVFADLKVVHPIRRRPIGEVETFKSTADLELKDVEITTEDQGSVLLRFKGGATGVLWVSQATAGRKNRLTYEIAGAQGSMAWDSDKNNEIWFGHRSKANESLVKDPGLLSGGAASASSYPGGHAEGYPDSFKQCFASFYGSIFGDSVSAPHASFADGHKEVLLCEAILKSHQEERWVKVGE